MPKPKSKRRITVHAQVTEAAPLSALVELFNHMLGEARSDPELGNRLAQLFGVPSLDDAEFDMRVQPGNRADPHWLTN